MGNPAKDRLAPDGQSSKLQRKIMGSPDQGWRQRYNAVGSEEWARGGPRSQPNAEAVEAYEAARGAIRG